MKKLYSGLAAASLILLLGACAKDTSVTATVPVTGENEVTPTVSQSQDYNQFDQALTDANYKKSQVSNKAKVLTSGEGYEVKPIPALASTPPTVTGYDPNVAANAGYPADKPNDTIKNTDVEGITDLTSALSDTSYEQDRVVPSAGPKVLYSNPQPDLKPTPETSYTPATVTGLNPDVSAKAGYPTVSPSNISKVQGIEGIENYAAALTDTTYTKDKISLENTPLSSKEE